MVSVAIPFWESVRVPVVVVLASVIVSVVMATDRLVELVLTIITVVPSGKATVPLAGMVNVRDVPFIRICLPRSEISNW